MNSITRAAIVLGLGAGLLSGCSTAPPNEDSRARLLQDATIAMKEMSRVDPDAEAFAKAAYGYAVFPEVTKGGLAFGGGYGRGVVYERGQHVGYADLTLGSVGLQIGGQTFSELIVFQDKATMDHFKQGSTDLTAGAGAMILQTGAAANADFVGGVAVFVRPITGAMAEATIGGQQFMYFPK